jgi:peptidoglycan/LPS O-acetylase OafA/YrhL
VLFVITAHSLEWIHSTPTAFPYLQLGTLALLGVDTFFVISGFLITHILLKELDSTGRIRLRKFYFRRFFRIFPPFYAYLAVVGILAAMGVVHVNRWALLVSGLYIWNYLVLPNSWLVGHTWSLSLEEQFYLLWPPLLARLGRRKSLYAAFIVIVLSPASRMITYAVYPPWRFFEWAMLHTRLDTIMFGCVLALLWNDKKFQRAVEKLLRPEIFACSLLFLTVIGPMFETRFRPRYQWIIGYPLHGVLISFVLAYVVKKPTSLPGRFLNLSAVKHIGVISYSLYLWQEMFDGPHVSFFPWNLIAIFACAELSYFLVERPALRLRDRLERRWKSLSGPPSGERRRASEQLLGIKDAALASDK